MRPRALFKSALIFIATALGVTLALYQLAAPMLELLLPLYRAELRWLMPSFHLDSLVWRLERDETVIALNATLASHHVVLGHVFTPGVSVQASTLAAHAFVHPVLILALVASWPDIAWKQRPALILTALPFALVGMLLDVPLMLWGAVEDLLYWQVAPAGASASLGAGVQSVLDGGARYAMALALALTAVVLFRRMAPGAAANARTSPDDDAPRQRPRSWATRT